MAGAAIETYLLERPRIVQQAQNERNFHIFYQLLAGAESSLLSKLDLTRDALHYTYLNSSKCVAVDGIDDRTDFTDVSTALNTIGMSRAEHEDLFGIVASLLHLGNVLFDKPRRDEGAAAIASSSLSSLAAAALRLGINRDELADKLVRRTMKMRGGRGGDSVKIPLSRSDAQIARDALAQFVYGTTFNFLVSRINQALPCRDSASFIGILDISGFEIFEHNSFEQLCINYANEKIQECFNMQMLLQEQEIYELEGLRWRKVDFQDNRGIIDLVEERHRGILAILDEECRVPKATDLTFGAKVHATHVGCSFLTKPKVGKSQRRLSPEEGFIINHFAGTVLYETKGFLEKNNATLHDDLLGTLRKTENESMQRILQHHQEITKISTSGNEKRFKSIGGRFNDQLSLLMTRLASTQSHFVRCIKPNQLQRPGVFVEPDILVQLRYSGMCAVLVLMQKGFSTRCTFEDIYQRYHHNFPAKFFDRLSRGTFCEAILVALDLHGGKDFQIGLTKVSCNAT
jgi:myosin heavy subunit